MERNQSNISLSPTIIEKINDLQGPIFIFGATGFVGANLLEIIYSVRKDVYALTHDSSVAWRLKLLDFPSQNILHCDILSKGNTEDLFKEYDPKTVFNLAAYGAYSKQSNINLTYETNIIGTVNILEASKNVKILLNTGSSSEYGYNCEAPSEDDDLQPNSHYSVSKISVSYLLKFYARQFNTPCANVRLYSIYGPWEEPDRLIPKLIEEGRKKKYPPFVNPKISRDFVYIDDCVEALLDLANCLTPENYGKSFNICTGTKTTIEDLAHLSQKIFGINESPVWGAMENRKWDLQDWYGNPALFHRVTNWKPKVSL
ncbi:MAG: NAD(P)-dependent oxidoreductase, partial [Cytophagales bacterium]|nr:NAD(P)-dependent oxidoreductase [Cytophagales bacterium]